MTTTTGNECIRLMVVIGLLSLRLLTRYLIRESCIELTNQVCFYRSHQPMSKEKCKEIIVGMVEQRLISLSKNLFRLRGVLNTIMMQEKHRKISEESEEAKAAKTLTPKQQRRLERVASREKPPD